MVTFLKFLTFLALFYAFLLIFLYIVQRQMIYFPSQNAPTPIEAGLPEMGEITLLTDDGLALKAWYKEAEGSNPTILYFHGNAGHIGHRAFLVKPFIREGFGFLLLTYRGYSDNPGQPTEEGVYKDGRAAVKFLQSSGVSGQCLILYGNSIGAAVALQLSTEFPIGALVLQSPFSSLADVAQYHYPLFPVRPFIKDHFDSLSKVSKIRVPVFVLHGNSDRIIPPKFSQRLFDALPGPKEAEYIPERGHNDLFEPDRVLRFIKRFSKCS